MSTINVLRQRFRSLLNYTIPDSRLALYVSLSSLGVSVTALALNTTQKHNSDVTFRLSGPSSLSLDGKESQFEVHAADDSKVELLWGTITALLPDPNQSETLKTVTFPVEVQTQDRASLMPVAASIVKTQVFISERINRPNQAYTVEQPFELKLACVVDGVARVERFLLIPKLIVSGSGKAADIKAVDAHLFSLAGTGPSAEELSQAAFSRFRGWLLSNPDHQKSAATAAYSSPPQDDTDGSETAKH